MAARTAPVAAILLAAAACFQTPVSERVEIDFVGNEGTTVRTIIRLRPDSELEGRPRERVARIARAVADESDAWSLRIHQLEPDADRYELERRRGAVVRAQRTATLERRALVERIFAETPVGARYTDAFGWQELSLVPDRTGPAPMWERRRTDAEIESWGERAAEYYAAADALWAFVASNPDRARPCFDALFVRGSPAPDAEGEEEALLERLEEGMGAVLSMLAADPADEYTLSERVRRAYDPFPAAITVRVPGPVLEIEGFAAASDGAFTIEALDLWNAFRSLEGRWITPDPAVAMWKHETSVPRPPFDLDAFVTIPRTATRPPKAAEIVSALRNALEPETVYRVRWRRPDDGPPRGDPGR